MAKYINADEMLKEYEHGIYDTTDLAEMLYYMPAADVVEVRYGHWVKGKCSECGCEPIKRIFYRGELIYEQSYKFNYCPSCGAKMKGDIE